jgi:hypothetical protein
VIDAVGRLAVPEPLEVQLGIASGLVVVGDPIGAAADGSGAEPGLSGLEVLGRLKLIRPDRFDDQHLRTVQRAVKAWRGQQARRIIAESAAVIVPQSRVTDRALPDRYADTGDHRAVAAMGVFEGCEDLLRSVASRRLSLRRIPRTGRLRPAPGPSE